MFLKKKFVLFKPFLKYYYKFLFANFLPGEYYVLESLIFSKLTTSTF
mgnify:CR=1 FL=1